MRAVAAKKDLQADELRPYRVDLSDDIYTRLRNEQGFVYDDALSGTGVGSLSHSSGWDKEPTSVLFATAPTALRLFMPGCALASYSRELTLAVYNYLRDAGEVDGLSVMCCGRILDFAATPEESAAYGSVVAERLAVHNVTRIVTACPNCYQSYTALLRERSDAQTDCPPDSPKASETSDSSDVLSRHLEVLAVSEILARRGVRFAPTSAMPFASACMHDSCPDRAGGVFARSVRRLFENVEVREMAHNQARSRCCGQGKLLPLRQPEQSTQLIEERIAEFAATDADCLVSSCVNCAQALRGASKRTYHYLELLFGVPIDWDAVASASSSTPSTYSFCV